MNKIVLLAALCAGAFATPAAAKDVAMTLNDQEQVAFTQILDLAAKAGGLSAANTVAHFGNKLLALQQAANAPAPAPSAPPAAAKKE